MKTVLGCIRRACEDFSLIDDGDHVLVGVSGGKDSMLLLHAMNLYRRFSKSKYTLGAVTLKMGYEPFDVSTISEYCKENQIDYHVIDSDIFPIIFEKRHEKNPCSLCAKMRRGMINDFAKANGYNKLCYAHHREDVEETLLLSLLHEGRLYTFHPKTYLSRTDITVIRPMVYLPESHIIHVVKSLQLPIIQSNCPIDGKTQRQIMKETLDQLCRIMPDARKKILHALCDEEQYGLWYKNPR